MARLDIEPLLVDMTRAVDRVKRYELRRREDPASVIDQEPAARERGVMTRDTWNALRERTGDPAAPLLAAWSHTLLVARVNREAELMELLAREAPGVLVDAKEPEYISVRTATKRLLAETRAPFRDAIVRGLISGAAESGARAFDRWSRVGELNRLLGIEEGVGPADELKRDVRLALATDALGRTDDLARGVLGRTTLAETIALAAGHDDDVPWPRHLSARWVTELFRGEARWLDMPGLDLGVVPPLLGSSTIARALARFGARWADSAAPRELPWPLANSPGGLPRRTAGALVANLLASPAFLTRAVGLSRPEAERAGRPFARTQLVTLRVLAAKVLMRPPAERGDRRALEDTAEEVLSRALNTSYPRPLTLVFPRFHRDDEARFLGLCEAAQLGAWLRDRHDDDWFRNPRALIDLKHRFGQPPLAREGELTPTIGLARLVEQLGASLA